MAYELSGIRLKFKRGWELLQTLRTEIAAYLELEPYRPRIHWDKQSQILTVDVEQIRAPDPMWGVRAGEIVHNFRSALDHIVWELAHRPSARESKTQFPIFEHFEGFHGRGTRQFLKGVGFRAIDLIRSEQPFSRERGGTGEGHESPLWHAKELSDIDKHRTLHVVAATIEAHRFEFPAVSQPFQQIQLEQYQGTLISSGTILWRGVLSGATEFPFESTEVKASLTLDVAFEPDVPVKGSWAVFGTLAAIGNRSEHIVSRIAREILRSEL
jgi:hypothetical protein